MAIQIRPLTRADKPLVQAWLDADEVHRTLGLSVDQLFEPGSRSVLISDERGPLLAVRLQLALRVAMQFDDSHHFRTAKAAPEVVCWLKQMAETIGATEVIIRPGGKARCFAAKLGFRSEADMVIRTPLKEEK